MFLKEMVSVMDLLSVVIVLLIFIWIVYAVRYMFVKKKDGCCSCNGACSSCNKNCNSNNFKKKY